MQIKRYDNRLYVFEKRTGMTGVFSEKEEQLLYDYGKSGHLTPFIERLYDLGILTEESQREKIVKAIESQKQSLQLDALHIEVTSDCPLKCPQCYKAGEQVNEMTFDQFKQYIDEGDGLNVFQIAIGGGEALIHPKITDFVKYVGQTEMSSSITTSGFGLSERKLKNLIEAGLNHMQISLNSSQASINNLSRDGYAEAINALRLLSETTLSYGINMVIRKDNLQTFLETVEFAKKMGAQNINLLRYKPTSLEDYKKNKLSEDDFYNLVTYIRQVKGIKIKVDSAYSKLLIYLNNGKVNQNRSGCMANKSFIVINSAGYFKPCSHLKMKKSADSIYQYYSDEDNRLCEDFHIKSLCYRCQYKNVCGGCLAICKNLYLSGGKGERECVVYKQSYK